MLPNQVKTVSTIFSRLEKRLFLLRNSLTEAKETGNLKEKLTTKKYDAIIDEGNQLTVHPTTVEYTLAFDCCDIEASVNRILNELVESNSYTNMSTIVEEYEEARQSFEKHQKILDSKRQQIAEQKKLLAAIQEKEEPLLKVYAAAPRKESELSEANVSLVKEWMECKVESKKEYYDYLVEEVRNKIEDFDNETRMQIHTDFQMASFWLLKYESFVQDLDSLLRKLFDEWSSKKREISILKKYRKLNLDKIQRISEEIVQKEEVIQTDRMEKKMEKQRQKEEQKRQQSATLIQALWRGTMVRKHLGPYKIKKKKKKKGKKGKKKKKGKK